MDETLTQEFSECCLRESKIFLNLRCRSDPTQNTECAITRPSIENLTVFQRIRDSRTALFSCVSPPVGTGTLFMAEFYKAVVRNGCDIHDAFRKARQTVRQRYPDPYYWAGFLLLD